MPTFDDTLLTIIEHAYEIILDISDLEKCECDPVDLADGGQHTCLLGEVDTWLENVVNKIPEIKFYNEARRLVLDIYKDPNNIPAGPYVAGLTPSDAFDLWYHDHTYPTFTWFLASLLAKAAE